MKTQDEPIAGTEIIYLGGEQMRGFTVMIAVLVMAVCRADGGARPTIVFLTSAPGGFSAFVGTSNPLGIPLSSTIIVSGHYTAAYLNSINPSSGNGTASKGYVQINGMTTGDEEIVALKFKVTTSSNATLHDPTTDDQDAIAGLYNGFSNGAYNVVPRHSLSGGDPLLTQFHNYWEFIDPAAPGNPNFFGIDLTAIQGVPTTDDGTLSTGVISDIGVVPEPASLSLLAIGGLMLLRRRSHHGG